MCLKRCWIPHNKTKQFDHPVGLFSRGFTATRTMDESMNITQSGLYLGVDVHANPEINK